MINDLKYILVSEEKLEEITSTLAKQICDDYRNSDKKLVLICILKGSLMFTSDLMKKMDIPLEVEFMKVSSYGSESKSTGIINIHLDLKREVLSDANFVIVEDIIDSGNTLSHLVKYLSERGANSVRTCTLLDKPSRRVVNFSPDYCGIEIPDEFVVGYGLDFDEKYRNLPYIGVLAPAVYGG